MRRLVTIAAALALALAGGVGTRSALASTEGAGIESAEGSGAGTAEGEAHGAAYAGGHGAGGCLDDHWYLLSAIPALSHNLCGMLGNSYVEGTPVGRGSHIPMAVIVAALSILFALFARKRLLESEAAIVPQTKLTFATFFEILVETVFNLMARMMGEKHARQHLPLIAALAIFILFSNLAGAIPGLLPPTDNLNTTFALGIIVFFMTHYAGVKEHGPSYFKHFLGPIIKWYALPLMIIMVFIETISHLVRPASLAVRLMGNIFGDHKVLGIFLGFHLVLVPLPIQVLGLLVAVVQTLVFCLLSIVYISMAVEHAEGH